MPLRLRNLAGTGALAKRLSRTLCGGVALGAVLALGAPAPASAVSPDRAALHGIEGAFTLSPRRPLLTHVRFCLFYDGECDRRADRRDPRLRAADHLAEARRINEAVNAAITPVTDAGFDS